MINLLEEELLKIWALLQLGVDVYLHSLQTQSQKKFANFAAPQTCCCQVASAENLSGPINKLCCTLLHFECHYCAKMMYGCRANKKLFSCPEIVRAMKRRREASERLTANGRRQSTMAGGAGGGSSGGQDKEENKQSLVLLIIVLLFLVCNVPRIVLNSYEVSQASILIQRF